MTLVETMVACVVLLVGMAATLTFIVQAAATTVETRTREQATSLQRELVEAARSVPYDQLTPNGVGAAVRARPALGDSSVTGAGWTIRRRNATYTVAMGVCAVDDPRDGTGPHEAGVFCAADASTPPPAECASLLALSTGATGPGGTLGLGLTVPQLTQLGRCGIDVNLDGTIDGLASATASLCVLGGCTVPPDANPADYKRIVSRVTWGAGKANVQTSQINNPGLSAAPAVTSLTPQTTSVTDLRTSLPLGSTTTGASQTVALYLDGTAAGTASSLDGANWTTSWTMGAVSTADGAQPAAGEVLDGSYQLSEKAFDQYGQYGATRSQTVVVNRRRPFAPARVAAGRNGAGVEVHWSPALERDVEGFRVERRVGGGAWTTVCVAVQQTSCSDDDPPAPSLLTPLEYAVSGLDRDPSGAQRRGDRSAPVPVPATTPAVPAAPGALQATLGGAGVQLTWSAPPGPVGVDHYNVYRDGTALANRLDSVWVPAGQPLAYTDTRTGGQLHGYWVTAVNGNLGESAPVGPVQR